MRENTISVDSEFLLELALLRLDVRSDRITMPEVLDRLNVLAAFFDCESEQSKTAPYRRPTELVH